MSKNTYTREEVYLSTLDYFNGDDLAADVWVNKYALKNSEGDFLEKSPEDMHRRMAREFARIEEKYGGENQLSEDEIFKLFDKFRWVIPQGSVMACLGDKEYVGSLSNCVTLPKIYDSYDSICYTDAQLVQLYRRRCGGGIDISSLRPKGSQVKNVAKTSTGPVSFMERFSNTTREVAMEGRRGALMITMKVNHPDILDFINAKRDLSKVTGANISVFITDEFMNAVRDKNKFELQWKSDNGSYRVTKEVDAVDVWESIAESVWESAEPGVLFLDRHLQYNPAFGYKDFNGYTTNPCQPDFALVLTPEGIRQFKDIQIGSVIWSGDKWTKVINKIPTGRKEVFKYSTTSGYFIGTEDHRVVCNGSKVKVSDARYIDFGLGPKTEVKRSDLDPKDIMDGLVLGDGSVHKASNNLVYLIIGMNDGDYFESEIKDLLVRHRPGLKTSGSATQYEIEASISYKELPETYNREVPERFFFGSDKKKAGFLRGLFSANGSVVAGRVTLKQSSRKLIEQVQVMLSSLGIHSYITTNKSCAVKHSNGIYISKESYNLNITSGRSIFRDSIGFIQKYKQDKIIEGGRPAKVSYDIKNIESLGEFEVYDITVDCDNHTYWSSCCLVSNCSEVYMGSEKYGDTCRLIAVNLYEFVDHPFESNSTFNLTKFKDVIYKAQRLSDDLVDLEIEYIDRIIEKIIQDPEPNYVKEPGIRLWENLKESAKKGRRTGLGFTALADTLAALGLKYDSEEALSITERIMRAKCEAEFNSSVDLAIERGAFPAYDSEIEKESLFIQMLQKEFPELYDKMKEHGRRNISLSTVAPTGSVSILTQTSSGIEPVFMLKYTRRRKINDKENADFVDESGDAWQEYEVIHPKLKKWMEVTGNGNVEESPYNKSKANDIDWKKRIELQAVVQLFTSHSISSCLVGDTIINTNRGQLKLEELAGHIPEKSFGKPPIPIKTINKDGELVEVSEVYNNGKAPTIIIKLVRGLKLQSTYDHKFIVLGKDYSLEWKKAIDINEGDILVQRKSLNLFEDSAYNSTIPRLTGKAFKYKRLSNSSNMGFKIPSILTDETYDFIKVVSTEDGGVQQTYDLSVPQGNSYLANGFISHNTLNVSEDTTKETVSDIYFYAWMKGLKGATVYRQGSRSGVLIESKELVQNRNGSKIIKADAPKRPTSLPCNIHHLQADYHKWIVIVGMLNEDPYEVFAFKEKDVKLPRSVIQGTLTKVERGKYNLVTRNKTYEHISNLFESAEQEALTRMISTALRHGSDISFIVSQLMKSQGTIFSFSKAIARTLNKYVKEVKGFQCSDCGSSNIKLEEGCMTCLDCGSSKCS